MGSSLDQRYWPERRNAVPVVADTQTATLAIFSSDESAASAAERLETGALAPDTFHWHRDPDQELR